MHTELSPAPQHSLFYVGLAVLLMKIWLSFSLTCQSVALVIANLSCMVESSRVYEFAAVLCSVGGTLLPQHAILLV